jgi:hypothetical protein
MAIAESDLLKIATGRREYLLKATTDGRQIRPGGELYYNIEKYLMDYVENLCRVNYFVLIKRKYKNIIVL